MGSDYLIDTNTIIYLLDKKLSPTAEVFITSIIDEACQLSIISQIELLNWLLPDQEANDVLEKFVADCQIVDLSASIVRQTIQLRQLHKLKLPDAVIAATALVNNWTLISRNDSDFRKIQNLKYINPFSDL